MCLQAKSHLVKKGCAERYCCGNRGPVEGADAPPVPTEDPGSPGLATGKQVIWVRRRSPWGPCRRLGMGWRAVRGVLVSGRGGLL